MFYQIVYCMSAKYLVQKRCPKSLWKGLLQRHKQESIACVVTVMAFHLSHLFLLKLKTFTLCSSNLKIFDGSLFQYHRLLACGPVMADVQLLHSAVCSSTCMARCHLMWPQNSTAPLSAFYINFICRENKESGVSRHKFREKETFYGHP